jgi:hypothetical protein
VPVQPGRASVLAGLGGGERLEPGPRGREPDGGGDVSAEQVFPYSVGQSGRQEGSDVADGGRAGCGPAAPADGAATGPLGRVSMVRVAFGVGATGAALAGGGDLVEELAHLRHRQRPEPTAAEAGEEEAGGHRFVGAKRGRP